MNAKPVATPFQIQVLENHHNDYPGWAVYAIRSAENVHLATVGAADRYHQNEYADIANLFRAAPDLLAALESAENWLTEHESGPDTGLCGLLSTVRAAIAKAKGE